MKKRLHAPRPSAAQNELIDKLGGPKTVSEIVLDYFGEVIRPQAVSMWKKRGIPYAYRASLAAECKKRRIAVPDGFMGKPVKAARR